MSREWVKPGAKVAIYQTGWATGTVVAYDEIDRVLKRDIILKGGRRFYFRNAANREPVEVGRASDHRVTRLLPVDHPTIRKAEAESREQRYRGAVDRAHLTWSTKPTRENGDTLIRAIENWQDIQ